MTQEEVLEAFKQTEALLEGHFELRSKLHSNRYFQCANVLRYPRIAAKLCDAAVEKLKNTCDLGKIDGVISPAVGGILVGHEVARHLDVKCVFAEKVQGEGVDASGKQTHTELLAAHLEKSGYKVRRLSFPMYDSPTSSLVKMYLSGELGKTADDVDAYCASTLFAADRFASYRCDWQKDFNDPEGVIAR